MPTSETPTPPASGTLNVSPIASTALSGYSKQRSEALRALQQHPRGWVRRTVAHGGTQWDHGDIAGTPMIPDRRVLTWLDEAELTTTAADKAVVVTEQGRKVSEIWDRYEAANAIIGYSRIRHATLSAIAEHDPGWLLDYGPGAGEHRYREKGRGSTDLSPRAISDLAGRKVLQRVSTGREAPALGYLQPTDVALTILRWWTDLYGPASFCTCQPCAYCAATRTP